MFTGSCDFSKRMEASVRSLSFDDVLRTLAARKLALSKTMLVVDSAMLLSIPPITPAIAMGPAASAITRFDGSSEYVSPLSALMLSPILAGRAKIVSPLSLARSNACVGWPISAMM